MTELLSHLQQYLADHRQAATGADALRINAAIAALNGDLAAVEQHIAASTIPDADWQAAKSGQLDY